MKLNLIWLKRLLFWICHFMSDNVSKFTLIFFLYLLTEWLLLLNWYPCLPMFPIFRHHSLPCCPNLSALHCWRLVTESWCKYIAFTNLLHWLAALCKIFFCCSHFEYINLLIPTPPVWAHLVLQACRLLLELSSSSIILPSWKCSEVCIWFVFRKAFKTWFHLFFISFKR